MIREFEKLTDSEIDLMLKAPVLVCILIAGADGNIDKKEIKEAIMLTQKRTNATLAGYLSEVSQDFEDKLKVLIQSYPHTPAERAAAIMKELGQLDAVFAKMDRRFAAEIYQMLKQLAAKIASSSGGIWGMNTVTDEEAKYLDLSVIQDPMKV
jgi:tellurite resistance protein